MAGGTALRTCKSYDCSVLVETRKRNAPFGSAVEGSVVSSGVASQTVAAGVAGEAVVGAVHALKSVRVAKLTRKAGRVAH